jgi:hypothetical protein
MLLTPCFNRLPVCPTHIATTKGHLNLYNRMSLMCLCNMVLVWCFSSWRFKVQSVFIFMYLNFLCNRIGSYPTSGILLFVMAFLILPTSVGFIIRVSYTTYCIHHLWSDNCLTNLISRVVRGYCRFHVSCNWARKAQVIYLAKLSVTKILQHALPQRCSR